MPEMPEVETVRRGLTAGLAGRTLVDITVHRGDLRRPVPPDFAARLRGRRVVTIDRLAKYLLIRCAGDVVVIGHLGMSGRVVMRPQGTARQTHDHIVFALDDDREVAFNDPRRFGLMDLCATAAVMDHPLLAHLGVDPLAADFDDRLVTRAFAARRAPLKSLLLDQRIIAGIGNIYACESLYHARLSPRRSGGSIGPLRAARLVDAVKQVLSKAIAAGGSSLRDYVQTSGELGYFQHGFAVYDREGAPCPRHADGHVIRRIVQGSRSTFFCPACQR